MYGNSLRSISWFFFTWILIFNADFPGIFFCFKRFFLVDLSMRGHWGPRIVGLVTLLMAVIGIWKPCSKELLHCRTRKAALFLWCSDRSSAQSFAKDLLRWWLGSCFGRKLVESAVAHLLFEHQLCLCIAERNDHNNAWELQKHSSCFPVTCMLHLIMK